MQMWGCLTFAEVASKMSAPAEKTALLQWVRPYLPFCVEQVPLNITIAIVRMGIMVTKDA